MPTYEYVCDACDHAFEEFQSIKADPLKKCPECGKNKLRRLIGTGAGIIFKGSGFYETDYRSDGYKKAAKADSEQKSKPSDSKTEGKTDTKSEAKAKPEATSSTSKSKNKDASN